MLRRPLRGKSLLMCVATAAVLAIIPQSRVMAADEPPVISPFGQVPSDREDAMPGYIELSDGSIHFGTVYLTRDKRLQVEDAQMQRQREVPLHVVKQIECKVKKEWIEKEWKFKETTSDEKMYTGREYPSREYSYVITLADGRKIEGPLSAIIYVQPPTYNAAEPGVYRPKVEAERFMLHKRDKGELGADLKSLLYVKLVRLGEDALKEAQQKAGHGPPKGKSPDKKAVEKKPPAAKKTTSRPTAAN